MNTIFSFHKEPKLTLVGAGPGDPELITLKGINAIKSADIVLYDALESEDILKLIPVGTPALSVGKRAGAQAYSQDEINELAVEFAFLYGHVVRLKGGDPFVFGRGAEEIEFAARQGVTISVIPGITSAVAAPAAFNIPVTSRGISESFWVVTGTTMTGAISEDVALAAQSTATVVILMGLNKLAEIMATFTHHGKSNTPVAIIQNGTLGNQRKITGTVSSIVGCAQTQQIGAPAVIIVGEVVRQAELLETIMLRTQSQVSTFQ